MSAEERKQLKLSVDITSPRYFDPARIYGTRCEVELIADPDDEDEEEPTWRRSTITTIHSFKGAINVLDFPMYVRDDGEEFMTSVFQYCRLAAHTRACTCTPISVVPESIQGQLGKPYCHM